MDTYENENQGIEPVHIPEEPEIPAGTEVTAEESDFVETPVETPAPTISEPIPEPVEAEKESTFTDCHYVKPEPAQQPIRNGYAFPGNTPKAPKHPKQRKKINAGLYMGCFAVVITAIFVIILVGMQNNTEDRLMNQIEALNNKISVLEGELEDARDTGNSVSGSPAATDGLTPGQVYAQNKNAVVAISCSTKVSQYGQIGTATSSGSGFILTDDGYVVTNFHVIEGADIVNVITFDGTEYPAMVKGYDANNDLAVLKVQAQDLPAVTLGKSSDLIIGDMVVAIGNPLGELTSTQTVGYISGKDRDVSTDGTVINMLQTDAAINPGNSGGPLFNMKGEVIGITTAKYSGTTSSGASIEGIGFAIPIDDVTKMIADIMAHGYVTGAYLGVSVSDIPESQASFYGRGALVGEVVPGYSAARAGVQVGDLIIEMGGYDIESVSGLTRALRNFEPGDKVTMTVLRQGREVVLHLTLDEKPNLNQPEPDEDGGIPMPSEGNYDDWYEYFYRRFYGKDPDQQP